MEGIPVPPPLPTPDSAHARAQVKAPAILMMVLAGLSLLLGLLSLLGSGFTDPDQLRGILESQPDMPDWLRQMAERQASVGASVLAQLPSLVLGALAFVGGLRMLALRNWVLAVAGSVALMIPCVGGSCCCLFGIPVGAWALYVLTRPEVKGAFRP
jgi:hypothetical protein